MIGSLLNRGLVLIFGYAYPAYECFKTVEKNKPEIEQMRFWCQYWILVAMLTVFERIGDTFISWLPMYSEAKLAFYIYLWYPKTKGTSYVYDSFFKPYVAKHETEIDRNLLELKSRAGDMAVIYFQKATNYGQTRVFEILQYVALQSTTTMKPRENQNPIAGQQPAARAQPENEKLVVEQEVNSSAAPLAITPSQSARRLLSANSTSKVKKIAGNSDPESSCKLVPKKSSQPAPTNETDSKQIEVIPYEENSANLQLRNQ